MSDLENKAIIAENISHYMSLHHETRSDLSKFLNVPYTTITNWIKGATYPRIDKIEMLAQHWGIRKSDLVERKFAGEKTAVPGGDDIYVNGDPELTSYLEMLATRSECRMLFSLAKGATKEDVEVAVQMIEALRKKEGRD